MPTKLTLRLEQQLIEQAKAYADAEGRSVSQLVGAYFATLAGATVRSDSARPRRSAPITQKLRGSLRHANVSTQDYRSHLELKHR